MSKIGLLIIFLLGAFAEASGQSSDCYTYPIKASASVVPLYIEFPEVTISGCEGYYKKTLFEEPISVRADITGADEKENYTLVMVDPDAPGHGKDTPWLHWIIANIPGELLKTSVNPSKWTPVIKSYAPPTPPDGVHRYFFLLYIETSSNEMNLEEPRRRGRFDLGAFIKSNHLNGPVAVSSFLTEP